MPLVVDKNRCGKCVRHCGMKAIYRLEDKYGTIL